MQEFNNVFARFCLSLQSFGGFQDEMVYAQMYRKMQMELEEKRLSLHEELPLVLSRNEVGVTFGADD